MHGITPVDQRRAIFKLKQNWEKRVCPYQHNILFDNEHRAHIIWLLGRLGC
jgi:hypothetical protein